MNLRFRIGADMPKAFVERGLSLPALLGHAGLPAGLFDQEKVWVSTEELFALWDAVAALSPDPLIGHALGAQDRIERYSPASIAMLYTRSFADALAHAGRYKKLTCPEEIVVDAVGDERAVRFLWVRADGPRVPEALVDVCFAWIFNIGRRGTGVDIVPRRVELRRPERHRAALEAYFGCAVTFGAAEDALVFHARDVERPFLTHNADLLAIIAPHLEEELVEQRAHATLSSRVKASLKRLLAGGRPEMREVARELAVAPRTLQRRIAEEGHTWQQLLEEARRELSRRYLAEGKLELNEVAFLLGYGDASSFFRAFRQWEGVSPGRWRASRGAASSGEVHGRVAG